MRPAYFGEVTNSFGFSSSASLSEVVELSVPLALGAVSLDLSMRFMVEEPLGTRFRVAFGIVDAKTEQARTKHETFAVKFTDRKVLTIRTKQPISSLLHCNEPVKPFCTLNFEKLLNRRECSNLYMILCIT